MGVLCYYRVPCKYFSRVESYLLGLKDSGIVKDTEVLSRTRQHRGIVVTVADVSRIRNIETTLQQVYQTKRAAR